MRSLYVQFLVPVIVLLSGLMVGFIVDSAGWGIAIGALYLIFA